MTAKSLKLSHWMELLIALQTNSELRCRAHKLLIIAEFSLARIQLPFNSIEM